MRARSRVRMTAEQLHQQYSRLPAHVACKLAAGSGLSRDELIEEATYQFHSLIVVEWARHDERKSSACTWLHNMLRWRLLSYIRKRAKESRALRRVPLSSTLQAKSSWLRTLLSTLGHEAAEVVHLIVNAPAEIVDALTPDEPEPSMEALADYLRDQCGWDEAAIDAAFTEVRNAIT